MTNPRIAKCLDPKWRYTRSESTDVAKTIQREIRRLKEAAAAEEAQAAAKKASKPMRAKEKGIEVPDVAFKRARAVREAMERV